MKVKELKETIRAKVRETLYAGKKAEMAAKADPDFNTLSQDAKANILNTLRKNQSVELEEKDYIDPDDEVREGVDDVDYGASDFKDYDSIYERMQKLLKYKG
jgi:hypothetical protein